MGNLFQSNPPYAPFARMLAIAMLHGWLFSLVALFLTVQIGAIGTTSELATIMATLAPTAWLVIAAAAVLIGIAIMAPFAALLAWPAYKRGIRSYAVYISFGALVGFLTFLPLGSFKLEAGRDALMAFEWLVASGAFGGWSFARQLNRKPADQTNAVGG